MEAVSGEQYREAISADVIIGSAGQEMLGGLHAAVYDEIRDVPEVGTATRLKCGHWKDGKMTSALTAIDPDRGVIADRSAQALQTDYIAVLGIANTLALSIVFAATGTMSTIAPLSILIPVSQLLIVAVIVAAAGLIAGVAPARRGADLTVLEAIVHA